MHVVNVFYIFSALNTFYTEAELEANEDFIVAQEEMEVEGQHYATDVVWNPCSYCPQECTKLYACHSG